MKTYGRLALLCGLIGLATTSRCLADPASVVAGKTLAFERDKGNCLSCHQIKGGDLAGNIGPSLDGLKERYPNRDDVVAIIKDETLRNPRTVMPPFGRNLLLSDHEIGEIVDFLYSQ